MATSYADAMERARALLGTAPPVGPVLQGGVRADVLPALQAQLPVGGDPPCVFLFPGSGGVFDGTPFGGPKSASVTDFNGTSITPVPVADPTRRDPWGVPELNRVYHAITQATICRKAGFTVVAACVGGANRSKLLAYCLDPRPEFWPDRCDAMQAVIAGYHNNLDTGIAPVAPKRASRQA